MGHTTTIRIKNFCFNAVICKDINSRFTYFGIIKIYETSSKGEILKILRSHPKLAVEKKLSEHSNKEQSLANLKNCTQEEFNEFTKLNSEYEKKFGFPFIMAVKGKDKIDILNNFRQRINNNIEFEFEESKKQVKKIALFRLNELFTK